MATEGSDEFDVAIIGGGFAGSINGVVLAAAGQRVIVLDAGTHPRFAIGESSTPLADSILGQLGRRFGVPEFVDLAVYGTWKRSHREIACGLKRGFTYYRHTPSTPFQDDDRHASSLMVAASASDERGDTHWYRPDVDHFLWKLASKYGCETRSATPVTALDIKVDKSVDGGGFCHLQTRDGSTVTARHVIDASGSAAVTAKLTGQASRSLQTSTESTFCHFRGVKRWADVLGQSRFGHTDSPFACDASAQHHLLGNQWLWCLRFDNGVTSVGLTSKTDGSKQHATLADAMRSTPSLSDMFANAASVTETVNVPQRQQFFDPMVHRRCVMLPTAAATIDPLHSTGIAHALSGVARIADALLQPQDSCRHQRLEAYRNAVICEIQFLDELISTAYDVIDDFERFSVACMVYFVAVITCEEKVQNGDRLTGFFGTHDVNLVSAATECCRWLRSNSVSDDGQVGCESIGDLYQRIANRLAPWNNAGLFDPQAKNRYAYTATK